MQTFMPYVDPQKSAQVLDNKRLGKQRVETIQILNALLYPSEKRGWINHPAVKMWRGYEAYLCKVYLVAMMDEWKARGFENPKCEEHYKRFLAIPEIAETQPVPPLWLNDNVCITHRSRLIQKDPDFYRKLFPDSPDNLGYLWPR